MQKHSMLFFRIGFFILAFSGTSRAVAQDLMRVERIRVIPEDVPILNIYVDEENIKWIANTKTLYKLDAKDHAVEVPLAAGEISLLQLPGGNHDIRWTKDAMTRILGNASVTTAAYDNRGKVLWIGTNGYGVFKLKADPELRLIEQLHIDNSKLRSDYINSIFIAQSGKIWIATEDGALSVENNQWIQHQKFFNILRIRGRGNELWAIGDDLIWLIDKKDNWTPVPINRREIEGDINDITVDPENRVWIASNVMTSYRIDTDRYQRFGPGQYFTSQFVNFVSVDDDATIWVGTKDKGLYIIEKESTITVNTTMDKYLDCNGTSNNAAVSVRAIGGKPPYQFKWAHGVTGDKLTDLGPGKYQLTVTDTEGSSKAATIEIANPFITLATTMDRPESGEGLEDGAASVKVTGGVPPYSYEWYSGFGEASISGVQGGTYGVTVTDAAGCTATSSVTIEQIVKPITVTLSQKEFIRCPGGNNALVVAEHSGGKAPFAYTWSKGGGNEAFLENLNAGNYSVTVSDASGISSTAAIAITEPPPLIASIKIESPAAANMNNGVATVQTSGGKSPYQYLWDHGETSATASKLSPRQHSVTVTDASGCTTQATVDISENILPLQATITQTGEINCAGQAIAGLKVDVKGGKTPFLYAWSMDASRQNTQSTEVKGLNAGNYSVTITDAVGNTSVLNHVIKEPAPIVASTIAETPALSGTNEGHAIVRAQGGSGKLSYLWDNGDTGVRTESLGAGLHTVTITDEKGCSITATVEIVENFLPLNASITQTANIQCAGTATGALRVDVKGGKSPITYQWNLAGLTGNTVSALAAGDYAVTITDAVGSVISSKYTIKEPSAIEVTVIADAPAIPGKNPGQASVRVQGGTGKYTYRWDNDEQSAKAVSLNAGLHRVTVTDEAGCSSVAEINIEENVLAMQLVLTQVSTITCAESQSASIRAELTGGKEPYSFSWSNGMTQQDITTLGAGDYTLTVTDAAGNTAAKTINIKEPQALKVTIDVVSPASANQADGKANAKVTGGTSPYRFQWSNAQTAAQVTSLAAGQHQITVSDANGCTAVAAVEISENILAMQLNLTQEGLINCAGDQTGSIGAHINGGKSPYQYTWSNGATQQNITSLAAGSYAVTITDAAGNSVSKDIIINEPDILTATTEVITPESANQSDGKAVAKATGGTTPYKYQWSNAQTSAQVTSLAAGTHQVTVSDANGCTTVASVDITEDILPLRVTIAQTKSIDCAGQGTGAVEVSVTGGKSPYSYQWSDNAQSSTRTGLAAGDYSVEVTDAANQKTLATVSVNEPLKLTGEIIEVRQATHERMADGKATAKISGGEIPYSFAWDNNESSARAVQLSVGPHSVTVTDAKGCSLILTTDIAQKILPALTAENLEKGEAVRMEKLQFEADSTDIDASSVPTLEELYAFLYDNPTIVVEIGGHTNGLPEHDYCDQLSTARAKAVADYIINKGIESKRIVYKGYGKRQPIATNQTPEGRRKNQRVEVKIVRLSE